MKYEGKFAVTFPLGSFFRRVRDAPKENSRGPPVKKVIHFGSVLDTRFDYLHSILFKFEACVKKRVEIDDFD